MSYLLLKIHPIEYCDRIIQQQRVRKTSPCPGAGLIGNRRYWSNDNTQLIPENDCQEESCVKSSQAADEILSPKPMDGIQPSIGVTHFYKQQCDRPTRQVTVSRSISTRS